MISGRLQLQRSKPKVLVENKISFAGPESELSIYDTFEQASRVALQSDQLLFCGMVTGKKVMHSVDDYEAAFYPHESFIMAPNQAVEIDFPEAKIHQPTTCLAIEISTERVQQIADKLNLSAPIDKQYGHWQYQPSLVHTHHNQQTQALLDRIVAIYTENEQDRSYLIDLAISELIVRLMRHQTRDFLLHHSHNDPQFNGLNAALHYIKQHLSEPLDINALCRQACMSRSKFFQQFKQHLGCTPMVYQQQSRLTQAATLIEQGQQITQVCYSLGYHSASHFSRLFKQFYGICPVDYKLRHLAS
ncbi:AraC family transcriptional regulator [Shewanella sp. 10N.286.52.C2]|uniref:AraC family transcriptional regulator n=1 Tax=unclassified Shewanella TaxID=196818 RepID=UPI000C814913|nr:MULTISPECIES: AraC family transcriptional regulator [unclassified Shewanella]MDO6777411.1 AraC family transcriptional regulator [Shewanella sp. 3_MG-2023]PMG31325.1 AraC family transcriptional regulator [Shewanella sp. 10N.286.52.C2]